ncbi:PLP-dependent aminotransferase family protein [Vibrio misgurnus]|uniref:MocR-like pyridoxine biosynthesis transcription factor PdxR n=1 Tax=Vibrio misgurnus TaxID=2993714 RepID=UPI0023F6DFD0|nr:PLP-dependent aminotransferase family protein [Vibrio sp. VCS]
MAINYQCVIEFDCARSLQQQVREYLVKAILEGIFAPQQALPSCRKLSQQLKVSRNTVSLVYESLLDDGYLISRPRSGYYLAQAYQISDQASPVAFTSVAENSAIAAPNWVDKIKINTHQFPRIIKPSQWSCYKYPFIYGQPYINDFPLSQWREASRKVIADAQDHGWLCDKVDKDVELLIEQIRTRVLPQRGIHASSEEILITIGSQNGLYLLSQLLMNRDSRVGVENPGYKEAYNIFSLAGAQLYPHQVDAEGLKLNSCSAMCDYFYVTPSHQAPTAVTMSQQRRKQILALAEQSDAIIIEDDYDSNSNFELNPAPALKALDKSGRVIYVSSFSKILAPGLRLGFVVAPEELIYELRGLRRLMFRHPPSRLQMEMAHFIAQGYYDSFVRRVRENTRQRWDIINQAVAKHLPYCERLAKHELSNALWLQTPDRISCQRLVSKAAQHGVLVETGASHFIATSPSTESAQSRLPHDANRYFRLGFHSIDKALIQPGIIELARAFDGLQ